MRNVIDIDVLLVAANRLDAQRILLIAACQRFDFARSVAENTTSGGWWEWRRG